LVPILRRCFEVWASRAVGFSSLTPVETRMRMEERYESHVSWRVGCARSELRRQSATWSKMPATPEAALFRCGTPEGREKGNAAELKLRVFKMGRGGTFGLKQGISRIDDLTTGEFASCSGVNLAGCIRVLWFVVWVWVWVGVGVGALGLVVRREWLPRDGDPGLRKRSKCQLPRDGRTAAAIPAWRACPLILTPARLSLHLPPWAERPMPDSKEGASHPSMPTAGALPPRHANRGRAGDPGACGSTEGAWCRFLFFRTEGRGFTPFGQVG
jgi:hypothetical protein